MVQKYCCFNQIKFIAIFIQTKIVIKSADGPGFLKGCYLKRDSNLEFILFWGQGPKIYQAKTKSWAKVTLIKDYSNIPAMLFSLITCVP